MLLVMRRSRSFRVNWLLVLGGLGTAAALWAFWLEPASLRNQDLTLRLPSWPQACDGLRVAVLGDLHVGSPFNGLAKLRRVVELTNAAEPDLVLLAGDYVIHDVIGGRFVEPEPIARVLAGLDAPFGAFAVLGNHDWWLDGPRVAAALRDAGIPVLEDDARPLSAGACSFWVAGVSDYWEGPHDVDAALAAVDGPEPVLVFTHNPDVFPEVPERVSLTIAAHTHGGQVALPFVGRPIVPSRYGQRYAIGHVVEHGRHLFVTPGVGTSILPVRFRVPPEVSVLELRAADAS